ncbi:MAG: CoA transferase [Anaerolineales bacterium]|nr:CoA transferase [Anaerolineales bacterium]MCB9128934.1 CoA transferase [Ardenticatenales bacterium]
MSALSDLLIVDLTRVLAGPYGTMVLADFGADVIKIEQPGRGDDTRRWGPPFTQAGESAYYLCANRNKRSLTLNLKHEAGRQILRELVAKADVLIENFKVGTMERMGLGYEALRELNPGLIYCAITGYGQTGPYRDRPGYDTVIEAQGGIMSITGPVEGPPFKVGVAIVDVTAGLYAALSILAALHHRTRTGEGQVIDIALFDAQLGWLVNVASSYLLSGDAPQRQGNAHATIVPYQPFESADGWLMIAVGNDRQFRSFCEVIGLASLSDEPRFATNAARVVHRDALLPTLVAQLKQRPTATWVEALLAVDVPCGPVNDIPTALADPQAVARAMVQTIAHPQGGDIPLVGPVPKLSVTPARIASPPPLLGEQSDELLRELLGYSDEEIAALREGGAV